MNFPKLSVLETEFKFEASTVPSKFLDMDFDYPYMEHIYRDWNKEENELTAEEFDPEDFDIFHDLDETKLAELVHLKAEFFQNRAFTIPVLKHFETYLRDVEVLDLKWTAEDEDAVEVNPRKCLYSQLWTSSISFQKSI